MKRHFIAMVLGAAPIVALAANDSMANAKKSSTPAAQERDAADAYFSQMNPKLTAQEKTALAIAQKWQATGATGMKPVATADGMVRFVFGAQQISIVRAVLQVCDIELQPGEQVNNLNVGDPRFTVEPALSCG